MADQGPDFEALDGAAPGPWVWRCGDDDYAALVSDATGMPVIQTTHGVDPENPTAMLIAAAPTLLHLAKEASEMAEVIAALVKPHADCGDCTPAVVKARALLARHKAAVGGGR